MAEFWDVLDENGNKTGRFHERGKPMQKGDGHLVVQIWIVNSKGEFLISKRSPGVHGWPNMWQATGGAAVAGDDSLKTALKETAEELGVKLNPLNGRLFAHYMKPHMNDSGFAFYDVWIFRQDVDLSSVVFQPEETCDAMWASKETIHQLFDEHKFIPREENPFIDLLFMEV